MKKKAVVFDFDGTIADSLPVLLESYNAIAPRFRLRQIKIEDIDQLRKLSYGELYKTIGMRPWLAPMAIRAGTKELRKRQQRVVLFPGIVDVINALKSNGHIVGVLTSNHSDVVSHVLESKGVVKLDFIISQRSLFAKHKAFKTLERIQKLRPDEIVYVGDESRDVVACRKAGVKIVGVTWGLGGQEAFNRTPADRVAATMSELEQILYEYLES